MHLPCAGEVPPAMLGIGCSETASLCHLGPFDAQIHRSQVFIFQLNNLADRAPDRDASL